jgi:predicted deacylase
MLEQIIKVKKLNIPVFQIGEGSPKVLFVTGVHGDELSGPLILAEFIKDLKLDKGSVLAVLSANPLGQIQGRRMNPVDNKDINRSGNLEENTSSKLILEELVSLGKSCDFVVDTHNFFGDGFVTAMVFQEDLREMALNMRPEAIRIMVDGSSSGTFCQRLLEEGVPALVMELPNQCVLTEKSMEVTKNCLSNLLKELGMIDEEVLQDGVATATVHPIGVRVERAGVFVPSVYVGQEVLTGERIGVLKDTKTLEEEEISSPIEGIVQTNPGIRFVSPGKQLLTIGRLLEN